MVINELRLNFMDPTAQATLDQQMRQFLVMEGGEAGPPAAAS
jgi:Fe-S cluster biosynthesis and repair protein YggX